MVLVSGFISYQFYRAHPASHRAQSELTPADQSSLNRALGRASAAVLVAGGLIAANAYSLARKTVRNIRLADEKKERMAEQMHQTGKMAAIGELAAGIVLGPSLFGLIDPSETLHFLAELGIILLLFEVGLDTEVNRRAMPDADRGDWISLDAVADTIVFLVSDAARALQGVAIPLRGAVSASS